MTGHATRTRNVNNESVKRNHAANQSLLYKYVRPLTLLALDAAQVTKKIKQIFALIYFFTCSGLRFEVSNHEARTEGMSQRCFFISPPKIKE